MGRNHIEIKREENSRRTDFYLNGVNISHGLISYTLIQDGTQVKLILDVDVGRLDIDIFSDIEISKASDEI